MSGTNGQSTPLFRGLPPMRGEQLQHMSEEQLRNVLGDFLTNAAVASRQFLQQVFDQRRNLDDECGYPSSESFISGNNINIELYRQLFDREPIATRVVEVFPKETWQNTPLVFESEDSSEVTAFEEGWDGLGRQLSMQGGSASWYQDEQGSPIWEYLSRADIRSGIGAFGVILLGIDDGRPLQEPVDGILLPPQGSMEAQRNRQGKIENIRVTYNGRGRLWPDSPMTEAEEKYILNMPQRRMWLGKEKVGNDWRDRTAIWDEFKLNQLEESCVEQWRRDRAYIMNRFGRASYSTGSAGPTATRNAGLPRGPLGDPRIDGDTAEDARLRELGWGTMSSYAMPIGSSLAGTDQQYFGVQLGPSEQVSYQVSPRQRKILFMRVFDESLVQVVRYEWNVRNPRFGMPVMYRVTLNDPREQHSGVGLPLATVFVHWSRIVHLCDNRGNSEIFGIPRMRPVLNRLLDIRKISGGSGEGYWHACITGLKFTTHPQLGGDVQVDKSDLMDQYELYINGFQRALMLSGMDVNTIAPNVPDPTPFIDMNKKQICNQLAIPIRVFDGSERGELASAQDDNQWNDVIRGRQNIYCTPRIICPLIDRLITLGVLPMPTGYSVEWPDLDSIGKQAKAQLALTKTQAMGAYIAGEVSQMMDPEDWYTRIFDMDEEEAEEVLQAVVEAQKAQAPTPDQAMPGQVAPSEDSDIPVEGDPESAEMPQDVHDLLGNPPPEHWQDDGTGNPNDPFGGPAAGQSGSAGPGGGGLPDPNDPTGQASVPDDSRGGRTSGLQSQTAEAQGEDGQAGTTPQSAAAEGGPSAAGAGDALMADPGVMPDADDPSTLPDDLQELFGMKGGGPDQAPDEEGSDDEEAGEAGADAQQDAQQPGEGDEQGEEGSDEEDETGPQGGDGQVQAGTEGRGVSDAAGQGAAPNAFEQAMTQAGKGAGKSPTLPQPPTEQPTDSQPGQPLGSWQGGGTRPTGFDGPNPGAPPNPQSVEPQIQPPSGAERPGDRVVAKKLKPHIQVKITPPGQGGGGGGPPGAGGPPGSGPPPGAGGAGGAGSGAPPPPLGPKGKGGFQGGMQQQGKNPFAHNAATDALAWLGSDLLTNLDRLASSEALTQEFVAVVNEHMCWGHPCAHGETEGSATGPTTRIGRIWSALFGKTQARSLSGKDLKSPMDSKTVSDLLEGKSDHNLSAGTLGGQFQDTALSSIMKETGRDDPPKVISSEDMDRLVKEQGWTPLYRAVDKAEQAEQFKSGDIYNGSGIYGNGTYVAKQRAYQSGEGKALAEVQVYGANRMRMALPPNARVVTHSALKKERMEYQKQLGQELSGGKIDMPRYQKMMKVIEDLGRFAALRNYDMIDASMASGHGYCVILNRSMLAVQKENVK